MAMELYPTVRAAVVCRSCLCLVAYCPRATLLPCICPGRTRRSGTRVTWTAMMLLLTYYAALTVYHDAANSVSGA